MNFFNEYLERQESGQDICSLFQLFFFIISFVFEILYLDNVAVMNLITLEITQTSKIRLKKENISVRLVLKFGLVITPRPSELILLNPVFWN